MIGASAFGHLGRQAAPVAVKHSQHLAVFQRQFDLIAAEKRIIDSRKEAAEQISHQLELAAAELDSLRPKLAEHEKQLQAGAELKSQLGDQFAALAPQVTRLETELKQRETKNQDLQNELARRTEPPPEPPIQIRPSNNSRDGNTAFVECRSDGIVLYNEDKPRLVPAGEMKKNAAFLEMLDQVSQDPDAIVTFLVRSDGISNYFVAREIARSKNCRNGKLPIVGQGDLDLSLVKRGSQATLPEPKREKP